MMRKPQNREMRFYANKQTGKIEIVTTEFGQPLASIEFTQEQAESFARQLVEAIEIVNENRANKSLIIPGMRPN